MVESIEVINFSNDSKPLKLVLSDPENEITSQGFAVTSVTGLGPGKATVNSSELVTIDGAEFINARLPKRTIKIDLTFLPIAYEKDGKRVDEFVADIRRKSYRYFPIKEKVKLIFTTVEYRRDPTNMYKSIPDRKSYYIEGIVEQNEPNIWSKSESSTIQIVCMDPYFKDVNTMKKSFNDIIPRFHYESYIIGSEGKTPLYPGWVDPDMDLYPSSPTDNRFMVSERLVREFLIMNNISYVKTGGIFTIKANGSVDRPAIFNRTTDQILTLNMTLNKGDKVVIDTRKGYKSATLKEGFGVDIINRIDIVTSQWIEFQPGENVIGVTCDNPRQRNNLDVSVEIRPLYAGI